MCFPKRLEFTGQGPASCSHRGVMLAFIRYETGGDRVSHPMRTAPIYSLLFSVTSETLHSTRSDR